MRNKAKPRLFRKIDSMKEEHSWSTENSSIFSKLTFKRDACSGELFLEFEP